MKINSQKEEYMKMAIRDSIAINPLISIRRMQEIVKKNTGRSISDKFLTKLMRKVRSEAISRVDQSDFIERLTEVRERYRTNTDFLSRIAYWKYEMLEMYGIQEPELKDRIQAIKVLNQLDLAMLRAELDTGRFEKRKVVMEDVVEQRLSRKYYLESDKNE